MSRPTDGRETRVCVAQIGAAHGLRGGRSNRILESQNASNDAIGADEYCRLALFFQPQNDSLVAPEVVSALAEEGRATDIPGCTLDSRLGARARKGSRVHRLERSDSALLG